MESSLAQQVKPRKYANVSDFIYSNKQVILVSVLALQCAWK